MIVFLGRVVVRFVSGIVEKKGRSVRMGERNVNSFLRRSEILKNKLKTD